MKKFSLLILSVLLLSCSSDDEDANPELTLRSEFANENNSNVVTSGIFAIWWDKNFEHQHQSESEYTFKFLSEIRDKSINPNSNFYNSILKEICADVIFFKAEEGKNIKIDDVRNLKSVLSRTSLSDNPRFTIIDEVEYLNSNSANALLKTLEEPSKNNHFILINNQQAELIETISSRCLKNNVYLNLNQQKSVINYFIKNDRLNICIHNSDNLTPGVFFKYNEIYNKYKIDINDNIYLKINKLLHAYKKDKNKMTINISNFLIKDFFFTSIKENSKKIDMLIELKSFILNKINDFTIYNLNINSVLKYIELKLNNVR